jgi:putative two-component system response regulator
VILMRWGDPSRILIADDSADHVRIVRRVLSAEGYACSSVDEGRAAFDACAAGRVDVVLLDIHMPGWDGLTVCRRLKSTPETCLIPVLMMTGDSLQHSHLDAIEAGADDFLPKPLALPELRARVRSASRMKRYIDELDNAAASIVMLGATIEARDLHTNGHCQRLSDYATALGERIGLDRHDLRALEQGGYIHDLGKIAIPDAVLFKPAPLTADEYQLVKSHPIVGDRICAPLRSLERARVIVRSHHETLDGLGYPDGLRGAAVPLLAQVTAVADVYDALVTDRPYRAALPQHVALEILWDEARRGKRDRALVQQFASIVDCSAATLDALHAPGSRPSPCGQAPHSGFQASSREHPLQRPSADSSCS